MKHYISGLFIWLNLFITVVQAIEWEVQYRPVIELRAVWGSASNDVFAVGDGAIFHYDGSSWSKMDTETYNLRGIWGSSSSDVFAVGSTIGDEKRDVILHYDGDQWTPINTGTNSFYPTSIWGSSSTDVFRSRS
jgi:hypothetical protein